MYLLSLAYPTSVTVAASWSGYSGVYDITEEVENAVPVWRQQQDTNFRLYFTSKYFYIARIVLLVLLLTLLYRCRLED